MVSNSIVRPIEMRWCLLKSEGCNRIKLVATTTILLVICYYSGGRCTFILNGQISMMTVLLKIIASLINMVSVQKSGQIAMEFGLVLSLLIEN